MWKSSDVIELDLPKHCKTKGLQPNIFGNLENCIKPSKNDFKTNSTCEKNMVVVATDINVKCWAIRKDMEFLYSSYEKTLEDEAT